MALIGTLTYQGQDFIYMETAYPKGSRQMILVSETDPNIEDPILAEASRVTQSFYQSGRQLNHDYLLGVLDPVRKKQFGSTVVLNLLYQDLTNHMNAARLSRTVTHTLGVDTFEHEGSTISMKGNAIHSIELRNQRFRLRAASVPRLDVRPKILESKLTTFTRNAQRFNSATFKDASLEELEREGFDTSWMKGKDYVPIHTCDEWDNIVIPAFIKEFKRWKKEKDFEDFLISIDFESTGLDPYADIHPNQSKAVYFSISFADNQSFGVFVDMEHFDNVDTEGIAERLTYLTKKAINGDRTLTFKHGGETLTIKRSEISTVAHNMMIDRMFGLTIGADVWFDLCTNQLSFNLDPFLTKGKNGLKHMVTKFFGIEYAELGEICGKKNKGMFRNLTDKRVIMMYGCADTDWHRLAAKKLLTIIRGAKDYYGVDHVQQHRDLDTLMLNFQAGADFKGMRIKLDEFKKEYDEKTRILNLYYDFMAKYVGRVKAYSEMEQVAIAQQRYNLEVDMKIDKHHIDSALPHHTDKWTGKELLKVLFDILNYQTLYWTTQNKKAKLEGKPFTPKPAVSVDVLKLYVKHQALATAEEIEEAFVNPNTLEKLKLYSMYIQEDLVDPVTNKVLIKKEEFNKSRYPFMMTLVNISPILKAVSAELKPVVERNVEYQFAKCNPTSAVTRRVLSPIQTVSGKGKDKYIAYTDEHYFGAVDQAAVEIRILYGLSKDISLIEPLMNPEKDSHTETASLMHQKPAYTIDKKTRKGIKFLAFGRPYGKEVWSSCKDFFGDNKPEHMAEMAYLFELYDNKLSSVMAVLNKVRDMMDEPVDMPPELFEYLELNPDKKYGRMINEFGYCQHLEIRENDEGYRQALRRKAGNFIIQGFAANLLRIIYGRLIKAVDAEGWLDNNQFMLHLPVHDEVDFSYSKKLNPIKLVKVLYKALTVKMEGFPTFFVGINFGRSWGDSKKDESELPVFLVRELIKRYDNGEFPDDYDFGDHPAFFEKVRLDYFKRRVWAELNKINKGRNVWDLDFISENFHNYTVRAYLADAVLGNYLIPKFHVKGAPDPEPVETLADLLPLFLAMFAKEYTEVDQYIVLGKKHFKVTDKLLEEKYEDIDSLFAQTPISEEPEQELSLDDALGLDDLDDYLEDEDAPFNFDDELTLDEDEYPTDGIVDIDTSFLNRYNLYEDRSKEEMVIYDSMEDRIKAEIEESMKDRVVYDSFKVSNGKVIIKVKTPEDFNQVVAFCKGKTSSSGKTVSVFVKVKASLKSLGTYKEEFLPKLDRFIAERELVK